MLEEGQITRSDLGTPQGGVISPLLANIYLHEVLDRWFHAEVVPRLRGRCLLVRYADDFLILFSSESDARAVLDLLPKRFGKYGLRLHLGGDGSGPTSWTFDLLGFTHYWALSRRGFWVVKRKTARSRFARALKRVSAWCRRHLHLPIAEQQQYLAALLRGHCGYYGITGNSQRLSAFRMLVLRVWRRWLDRRSQRARMNWDTFNRLLQRYPLPPAIAVHSTVR